MRSLSALMLALGLAGCATLDRDGTADGLAKPAGMTRTLVKTDAFTLTAFARVSDPAAPLNVYIEGDGLAWLSRSEPSLDPTPTNPVALRLAALDPSPNVVYLARPCQYTSFDLNPTCDERYWTQARFAEEVVAATNQAVDEILKRGGHGVRLVGFSGGGAVATLVAARRKDVVDLRTVAGNLDHAAWTTHHKVTPLKNSLNPADVAPRLAAIPQRHLIGSEDEIITADVADSYAARAGGGCIEIKRVEGATHEAGWEDAWRETLRTPPRCR